MLVDKQNELMSDLLFTVHQHGGDDVTWKPPIGSFHFFRTPPQKYDVSVFYRLPLKNEIRGVDCLTRIVATLFETLLNACEVWPAGVYENYFNSDF